MMPVGFNSSLAVFVPKGEEPDELSIVRDPCNTRPLSLKSCDNKVICAVVNFALRTQLATHACPVQRGSIPGGQLVSNVVGLDVYGPIDGVQPVDSDPSLISLCDFAAAFPSMSQTWIAACLSALGIPSGAHDLIMSMYCLSLAHSAAGPHSSLPHPLWCPPRLPTLGFPLRSRGRPLSLVDVQGHRACWPWEDSCLCRRHRYSFQNISALLVLYPIFAAIGRAAGSFRKPSKCVLVRTGHGFTPELVSMFNMASIQHPRMGVLRGYVSLLASTWVSGSVPGLPVSSGFGLSASTLAGPSWLLTLVLQLAFLSSGTTLVPCLCSVTYHNCLRCPLGLQSLSERCFTESCIAPSMP